MGNTPKRLAEQRERAALARKGKEQKQVQDALDAKQLEIDAKQAEIDAKQEEIDVIGRERALVENELNAKRELVAELEQSLVELTIKADEREKERDLFHMELENSTKELENLNLVLEMRGKQIEVLKSKNLFLVDSCQSATSEKLRTEKEAEKKEKKMLSEYEKKIEKLTKKIKKLVDESPTGGSKLKKWSRNLKRQTKNVRCRQLLECIKKSVGEELFDDFVCYFCRYIAKNKACSFKLALSEMDSFLATVKWKLSDQFLKEFKAFLHAKLGFDVFQSRGTISKLRNGHSQLDLYDFSVRKIMRKSGEREVEVETAVVRANDLSTLLKIRLERLHQNGQLRLDSDTSDIILGVGGDKGGVHTKLVLSLGNVDRPNNPHGLLLIGMFQGSDDYLTLKEHMSSVFEMLNDLEEVTYSENGKDVTRKIRKFAIGDCKFISAIIGHSGQSSRSPCFKCDLSWTNRGKNTSRLLDFDLDSVGYQYHPSALKDPLFLTHPDFIGPPGVHCVLGIAQNYVLDYLIALCNKIDSVEDLPESLKLQKQHLHSLHEELDHYKTRCAAVQSSHDFVLKVLDVVNTAIDSGTKQYGYVRPCGSKFCVLSSSRKNIFGKPELFFCSCCNRHLHTACSFFSNSDDEISLNTKCLECTQSKSDLTLEHRRRILMKMEHDLKKRIDEDLEYLVDVQDEIDSNTVNSCSGPTRKLLEQALQKHGCDMRTWYQQLTGNQVHSLLLPNTIESIMSIFPPGCASSLSHMKIVMKSLGIIMRSADNNRKTDAEIDELQLTINTFAANLKLAQPNASVTPKLHLITAHLIPFLRLHRSWGHLTEQGIEHLHAIVNALNSRLATVLDPIHKAQLIVKSMSNFNLLFDLGQSWFRSF